MCNELEGLVNGFDFAKVLSGVDRVILTDIYAAREKDTGLVSSKDLAEKIPGSVWFNTFEEMAEHTLKNAKPGDLVITLGCGDVYKCAYIMAGIK